MAELLDGQQLVTTTGTLSSYGGGTRVFDSTVGLPSIGDSFFDAIESKTYGNIVATSITSEPFYISTGVWKKKYIVTYETRNSLSATIKRISDVDEEDEESWTAGYGAITIDDPDASWKVMDLSGTPVGSMLTLNAGTYGASTCDGKIVKPFVQGSFTRTFIKTSESARNTFLANYFTKVGRVNDSVFNTFAVGNVLCGPLTGQNREVNGSTEWKFVVTYNWKINPEYSHDAWNTYWDQTHGWQRLGRVNDSNTIEEELYPYANITLS